MSWLFTLGNQSIGASSSVLLMNIQGWFPLGFTDLISLQSKRISGVISRVPQFKSINSSALSLLCVPTFTSIHDYSLMFKLVLEKAEEPEIKLLTCAGSWKKQESSRRTSISALLTMPRPLTVWITINCGKFWKRREYQTTWPASWEICMQVRKQQLELDMDQQTGSK